VLALWHIPKSSPLTIRYRISGLDGSFGHTLDDVLLGNQEEDQDRDDRQQRGSQNHVPLLDIGTDEVGYRQRYGLDGVALAENQQRQQEVVPDPDAVQDGDGDGDRLQHRQDDPVEDLDLGAAVNGGRLLDLIRNALDEAAVHEHAHREAEADIGEDRARIAAQQRESEQRNRHDVAHLLEPGDQRIHDDLERHDHHRDEAVIDEVGELGLVADDDPGRHGREQNDEDQAAEGDDQA